MRKIIDNYCSRIDLQQAVEEIKRFDDRMVAFVGTKPGEENRLFVLGHETGHILFHTIGRPFLSKYKERCTIHDCISAALSDGYDVLLFSDMQELIETVNVNHWDY